MNNQSSRFITEITPEEAALINGGRRGRGADDGTNHNLIDDRGRRGRGADDGPNHR